MESWDETEHKRNHIKKKTARRTCSRGVDDCCTDKAKHTGITKEEKKRRKQGKKATTSCSRLNKAYRLSYKAEPAPCHTICHLLCILVDSDINCQYCHWSAIFFVFSSTAALTVSTATVAPHLGQQINKNRTKPPGPGGCNNSGSTT